MYSQNFFFAERKKINHDSYLFITWIRRILGILFLSLGSGELLAVTAHSVDRVYSQPDGTQFIAHQWGDEWSNGWETSDGYSIVKSNTDGHWYYAVSETDGSLTTGQRMVGSTIPLAIKKHLRPSGSARANIISLRNSSTTPQPVVPPTGTANIPVLMMNFNDTGTTYSPGDFEEMLFSNQDHSMKSFYEENSFGAFSVSPGPSGMFGWGTANQEHDHYSNRAASLVIESIEQADSYIDFSQYDSDGDCVVDVVALIHQGPGQETSGDSNDIWSHRWRLNYAQMYGDGSGPYTTNDSASCGNLIINDYIVMPEIQYDQISTIGVFAHEYGHSLGLPDLYDTDGSSAGIGAWGLMASGSWNQVNHPGDSPSHMSAWSKYFLGWISPEAVDGSLTDVSIPPVEQQAVTYQFGEGSPSEGGEYYLIENRQPIGFDAGLPGYGLAVWHVDESKATINNSDNSQECIGTTDCNGNNYRVALVQADGEWNLERNNGAWGGDQGDLFPGSSGNTSLDGNTIPDSDWYDGSDSTMALSQIMLSGNDVITDLSFGADIKGSVDLQVNGDDGPLTLRRWQRMTVTMSVEAERNSAVVADWKLSVKTPFGPYYYDFYRGTWRYGEGVSYRGPVFDVNSFEVLNASFLPKGNYLFKLFIGNGTNGISDEVAVKIR